MIDSKDSWVIAINYSGSDVFFQTSCLHCSNTGINVTRLGYIFFRCLSSCFQEVIGFLVFMIMHFSFLPSFGLFFAMSQDHV